MARKPTQRAPGLAELRDGPLKTGEFAPVYLLIGADQLRAEAVVESIRRKVLDPAAAAFNEQVFHGDQAGWQTVLQAAQSFPMFGDRQLVWLKHVEALEAPGGGEERKKGAEGDAAAISGYLDSPAPQTILIVTGEKVDGRRAWVATAKKLGYFYAFDPPSGRDLEAWIANAARRAKLTLDAAGCRLLVDLVGDDLRALAAEIEKLALVEASRGQAVPTDELPGLIMDQAELDVFALTDSIVAGGSADVLKTWLRLQTWGKDAYDQMPAVVAHLRRVALVAAGLADGRTLEDIARTSGLNAWMVKNKLAPLARRLTPEARERFLAAGLAGERSLKQRPLAPSIAFEQLLLTMTNVTRHS